MAKLRIGTCSWKYDSWKGIIYPDKKQINYLKEYSTHFNTVEIDQWFWSLFGEKKINLPQYHDVEAYSLSVPDDFKFSVKIPNSLTLTHFYNKLKSEPLKKNPHFLSDELTKEFLNTLAPIKEKLGTLMFQFEYLNKKKMKSQQDFQFQLGHYAENLDQNYLWGVEIRNPNYLNDSFFSFLREYELVPVFLEGYYMPPVTELIEKYFDYLKSTVVIRLHGIDRKEIEVESGGKWNKIIEPKDDDINRLVKMLVKILNRDIDIYLNVNNHYEGSAPLTIRKINNLLKEL